MIPPVTKAELLQRNNHCQDAIVAGICSPSVQTSEQSTPTYKSDKTEIGSCVQAMKSHIISGMNNPIATKLVIKTDKVYE